MPDKFRDTFPVPISFVSGEQPSAAKLSAWAAQTNAALDQIEDALGDLHSDYFPLFSGSNNTPSGGWAYDKSGSLLSSHQLHLQIINLARLIGPASALNPRVLPNTSATIVAEPLPDDVNEFYLRYRPFGPPSFSLVGTKFATAVGSAALVTSYGEYFIDAATGKVIVWDGDGSNGTVTYSVATTGDNLTDTYEGATFNVFPGPQQSTKCTVAASGSAWRITLPTNTHQQADWGQTSSTLTSQNDINYNKQLQLPTWLTGEYVASDVIADGLLAVWDEDERRMIFGTFTYVSNTEVDFEDEDLVAGSNRYSLVVAGGTDITRTLDSVRTRVREHTHDGTNGDMRIPHNELDRLAVGHVGSNAGGPNYAFFDDGSLDWSNDHPQYLGRWGMDSSVSKNAMLGDLLISTVPNGGNLAPLFGTGFYSHKLIFGASGGPEFRYDHTVSGLHLDNEDLVLANDYKFDSARSASVVVTPHEFTWDDTHAFAKVTDGGGAPQVTGPDSVKNDILHLNLHPYVPEGATITSVEINAQLPSGASYSTEVDIMEDSFAASGATTVSGDSDTSGPNISATLTVSRTIDKSLRQMLQLVFDWAGSGTMTFWGARINFTHDTVHRGG